MTTPVQTEWMSSIVNVHFGGGVSYLLVTITAHNQINGAPGTTDAPNPPPPPVISAPGIPGPATIKSTSTPGKTLINKHFFIWTASAPFPDANTFGNLINLLNGFAYGDQFGLFQNLGGGFSVSIPPGANPQTGSFASLSAANAGALAVNQAIQAGSGGQPVFLQYFDADGNTAGPVGFNGFFGAELDIPSAQPGFASTSITQTFLIPLGGDGPYSVTVSAGNTQKGSLVGVDAGLWVGQAPNLKSPAQLKGTNAAAGLGGGTSGATISGIADSQKVSNSTLTVTDNSSGGGSV